MAALLPLLRHAVGTGSAAADAELLDRFAAGRDEAAFAELVRRHGPVVYRVCRRLVGPDAAEDAFQAAFLVLATRLSAARAAGSVGGWLVGVAGRVARQMRRAAGRRARHEAVAAGVRPAERHPDTPDLADHFRALDEEVARLPDRLRDPVVLCLLQGRTHEQAAAELGRDARTLRRRLSRAKQVLRARLERRGVVPAVAVALASGGGAAAAVPHGVAARTAATVFDFLTGGAGAARPGPVVLAKGVATTMMARKLMLLMTAVSAGLIGVGALLAGDRGATPEPPPAVPNPPALPRAVPAPTPPAPPRAAETGWARDEARTRAQVAEMGRTAGPEPFVLVEALCIQVPTGFLDRSGVADDVDTGPWVLSRREARMLTALLRSEPKARAVTRPQILLHNNQTGFCQTGQQVPVVTSEKAAGKGASATTEAAVEYREVGVSLRVTPRISADSRYVQLRIEAQSTELAGPPVSPGNGLKAPAAFNIQTTQTTVLVPDAGTAVVRSTITSGGDGKDTCEQVWVLTPHVGRGKVLPAGAAPPLPPRPPVPAAPPASPVTAPTPPPAPGITLPARP